MIKFLIICAGVLLCACHTQKHIVTNTEQQNQSSALHTSVQVMQTVDSLLHTVDFSADSVIILVTPTAPSAATAGATDTPVCAPAMKITAHNPKIVSRKSENNHVVVHSDTQDVAANVEHASSHADTSNDVVGVATPTNGTLATFLVLLAVFLIAAIVVFLFLRKYRII